MKFFHSFFRNLLKLNFNRYPRLMLCYLILNNKIYLIKVWILIIMKWEVVSKVVLVSIQIRYLKCFSEEVEEEVIWAEVDFLSVHFLDLEEMVGEEEEVEDSQEDSHSNLADFKSAKMNLKLNLLHIFSSSTIN
jgi:hypothetical protein